MTSEEMIEVYLDFFGCSKSNRATAKAALMEVLKGQRKMCANAIKDTIEVRGFSYPVSPQEARIACLNATGESDE